MSDVTIQCEGWGCRVASLTLAFTAVSLLGLQLSGQLSTAPMCKLTYEHNTVLTEAVILKEAAKAGWPLTHPECNVCADATDVPIWIAPGDLCTVRPALKESWEFCEGSYEGTEFAADEHVKVCVSRDELTTMWDAGLCHLSAPPSADDWFALMPDNEVRSAVNVGYDGTLFCAGEVRKSFDETCNITSITGSQNCDSTTYCCTGSGSYCSDTQGTGLCKLRDRQPCTSDDDCFGKFCASRENNQTLTCLVKDGDYCSDDDDCMGTCNKPSGFTVGICTHLPPAGPPPSPPPPAGVPRQCEQGYSTFVSYIRKSWRVCASSYNVLQHETPVYSAANNTCTVDGADYAGLAKFQWTADTNMDSCCITNRPYTCQAVVAP